MHKQINKISWTITRPFTTAVIIPTDEQIPSSLLNYKLPVRSGDTISLVYNNNESILTERISGSTFKSVMTSLQRGLQKNIPTGDSDTREKVYQRIAMFIRPKDRLRLINLFEKGKLKPVDLLGNHIFFEGGLRRGKEGIWTYALGS